MKRQQALALSQFYWSNIRSNTLLWCLLVIGVVLALMPSHVLLNTSIAIELAEIFPNVIGYYILPAFGFTVAMQWFCWASDIDFMSKNSCLPTYFCTLPVNTILIALLPIIGGVGVIFISWWPWHSTHSGMERLNFAIISAATFIWTLAVLWQPMPIRGARIPLILLVGLIFLITVFSWKSAEWRRYTAMEPLPITSVLIYDVIGLAVGLWSTIQARHNSGATISFSFLAKIKPQLLKSALFKTKARSHQWYEAKLNQYSLALIFLVMSAFPVLTLFNLRQGTFYPDIELFKIMFYVVFVAPLFLVFVSGLSRGHLALGNNFSNRQAFAPFFATLPSHSVNFVRAKFMVAAKNCLLVYGAFAIFCLVSISGHYVYDDTVEVRSILDTNNHGAPLPYLHKLLSRQFGEIHAYLIFAAASCVVLGMVILSQLVGISFGLAAGFSRLPKFSTYLIGFIGASALYYVIYKWVYSTVINLIVDHVIMTQLIVYVLAIIKLICLVGFYRWFNTTGKSVWILWPLMLLWFILISSMIYLAVQFMPNDYDNIIFICAFCFTLCPMFLVLLAFPALNRYRHS